MDYQLGDMPTPTLTKSASLKLAKEVVCSLEERTLIVEFNRIPRVFHIASTPMYVKDWPDKQRYLYSLVINPFVVAEKGIVLKWSFVSDFILSLRYYHQKSHRAPVMWFRYEEDRNLFYRHYGDECFIMWCVGSLEIEENKNENESRCNERQLVQD